MSTTLTTRQKWLAAIGLLLMLGPVLAHANQFGERYLGMTPLQSRDLFWWSMLVFTLFYVLVVERLPLASIGLKRPDWKTLASAAGVVVVIFAIAPLVEWVRIHLHVAGQEGSAAANAIFAMPWWYRFSMVARAGIVEELVFRGYAIERTEALTGSRIAGFVVSVVTFSLAHLAYWGWGALITVTAVGAVLTLFYQWRRDLPANMLAHFAVDGIQLLL